MMNQSEKLADNVFLVCELYCPYCDCVTSVVAYDKTLAEYFFPNREWKLGDSLIGTCSAHCDNCGAFLSTAHSSPEAALDYWEESVSDNRFGTRARSLRFN